MEEIELAAADAKKGLPAKRPVIEMTIPSSLDNSLILNEKARLSGHHIVQLFIQYAPYENEWENPNYSQKFADNVFKIIDEFAPNFSSSVIHRDILSPKHLESILGIHKGNIFHGALSPHQIGYFRPVSGHRY